MTLFPLADGARLLGIHPKTLCQWLKTAQLPLALHPTDARIRYVARADLLEVARLHRLEALLSAPLEAVQPSQQPDVAAPLAPCPQPAPRLLLVEVRPRSRVTALIEYGTQGQYVAVCPRQGVLALSPDSPACFDWLAQRPDAGEPHGGARAQAVQQQLSLRLTVVASRRLTNHRSRAPHHSG